MRPPMMHRDVPRHIRRKPRPTVIHRPNFRNHKKRGPNTTGWLAKLKMQSEKFTFVKLGNGRVLRAGNSKTADRWLNALAVKEREVPFTYFGKVYIEDGFDRNTNTIYEFFGDYYHGSHKKFPTNRDIIIKQLHKTPNQLYTETVLRCNRLHAMGYKIFFVWEGQYKNGFMGRYFNGPGDNLY